MMIVDHLWKNSYCLQYQHIAELAFWFHIVGFAGFLVCKYHYQLFFFSNNRYKVILKCCWKVTSVIFGSQVHFISVAVFFYTRNNC